MTKLFAEVDSLFSKYLYRKNIHEAGYDSMLTAIAFLKMSIHLDDGKLPKGKRGRLEDIAYGIATPCNQVVQDLFPEKNLLHVKNPFTDFFDTEVEADSQTLPTPMALADTEIDEVKQKVKDGVLIPRLGDYFWRAYANKLRVFGAVEKTVCFGPPNPSKRSKRKNKTSGLGADHDTPKKDQPAAKADLLICD